VSQTTHIQYCKSEIRFTQVCRPSRSMLDSSLYTVPPGNRDRRTCCGAVWREGNRVIWSCPSFSIWDFLLRWRYRMISLSFDGKMNVLHVFIIIIEEVAIERSFNIKFTYSIYSHPTLFAGVESQLSSVFLETFYIETGLLYTSYSYSSRPPPQCGRTQAQAGSQWSADGTEGDTSAHFPLSPVASSRGLSPQPH